MYYSRISVSHKVCNIYSPCRVGKHVGWVRFFSVAKKRNPPALHNVGLRYRASLDKLTQPTIRSTNILYIPLTQPSPLGEDLIPNLSCFKAIFLEGEGWVRGSQ